MEADTSAGWARLLSGHMSLLPGFRLSDGIVNQGVSKSSCWRGVQVRCPRLCRVPPPGRGRWKVVDLYGISQTPRDVMSLGSNFAAHMGSARGSSCLCASLGSAHSGRALLGLLSALMRCMGLGSSRRRYVDQVSFSSGAGMACLLQR